MTHRRAFLRGLAGTLAAAAAAPLAAADRALARTYRELSGALGDIAPDSVDFGARLRQEYLLAPEVVYLNHASIGTVPRAVHEAHRTYLGVCETNPWLYMWGGVWEEPREAVRARAGAAMGCPPEDVAITHNTTEGFNLIAQGLPLERGDEVLFSSLNHAGASVCFEHHGARRGYTVRRFDFPIERVPELTADEIVALHAEQIRPATRVLAFPHVDNIVGLRHPVAELTTAARRRGVEFVAVDGAQTVGAMPLAVATSGVDFYAASPHKWVQSPKGLGLLYARPAAREALHPMWVTWGQERWQGSVRVLEDYGTRNLPALLALGDALDFQAAIGNDAKRARHRFSFELMRDLATERPGFGWSSPRDATLGWTLAAVSIEGLPSPDFSDRMLERGFVFRPFRTGGLNSVRLSPNLVTSEEEIRRFFDEGERVLEGA